MTAMSKSADERYKTIQQLLDRLLGPVDEWSRTDLDRAVADAGIDVDETDRKAFERVSEIAASYRQGNRDVPRPVAEFLRQMRPTDLPAHDAPTAKASAQRWIARLRRPSAASAPPQVAYAFRNKKDQLDSKDRAVLEGLEAKLRSRMRDDGD